MAILNKKVLAASLISLLTAGSAYAGGDKSAYSEPSDSATTSEVSETTSETDVPASDTGMTTSDKGMAGEDQVIVIEDEEASRSPASADQSKEMSKDMKKHAGMHKKSPNVSIDFEAGKADLTQQQKDQLRQVVTNARQQGDIEKINLAVWSDQALPSGQQGQELPESARNLAQQRIDNLSSYIEDELKVSEVETFNMAEQSNWLARTFNTNEAELKSVFGREGSTPIKNDEFQVIKKEGAPGKAIAVVSLKGKDKSKMKKDQPAATSGTTMESEPESQPSTSDSM